MTPMDRAEWRRNEAPRDEECAQFILQFSDILPTEYIAFMTQQNGGSGFIGECFIDLWKMEYIDRFYNESEIRKDFSFVFPIGDNGGNELLSFDLRSNLRPLVWAPFIGMGEDQLVLAYGSFRELEQQIMNAE